jgi:hypothetical protein
LAQSSQHQNLDCLLLLLPTANYRITRPLTQAVLTYPRSCAAHKTQIPPSGGISCNFGLKQFVELYNNRVKSLHF